MAVMGKGVLLLLSGASSRLMISFVNQQRIQTLSEDVANAVCETVCTLVEGRGAGGGRVEHIPVRRRVDSQLTTRYK